jgi:predicted TIM-barrel fold metal-dependent hydrolase
MPILSTSRAVSALKEIIEIGTQDKICWGCDTWTSEESMGALMAARFVFARTMSDLVQDGYLSKQNGFEFIDNIMYNNAKRLYKL